MIRYHRAAPDAAEAPRAGTVTALEAQQKQAGRVSVFIDGAFAFGMEQDLLLEYPLRPGLALDEATLLRLLADEARLRARRVALAYLARRARTTFEVRDTLQQRGFTPATIDEAVARMQELGYLDDAEYARRYVETRVQARGIGPARLRTELLRRGVAAPLIAAALAPLASTEVASRALQQARSRIPALRREPDSRKRRKKLIDYLLRRGFDFDTIQPVVEAVLRDVNPSGR